VCAFGLVAAQAWRGHGRCVYVWALIESANILKRKPRKRRGRAAVFGTQCGSRGGTSQPRGGVSVYRCWHPRTMWSLLCIDGWRERERERETSARSITRQGSSHIHNVAIALHVSHDSADGYDLALYVVAVLLWTYPSVEEASA